MILLPKVAARMAAASTSTNDFAVIATAIRESRSVALDLQTYGPRKSHGLDPWAGDILQFQNDCWQGVNFANTTNGQGGEL